MDSLSFPALGENQYDEELICDGLKKSSSLRIKSKKTEEMQRIGCSNCQSA